MRIYRYLALLIHEAKLTFDYLPLDAHEEFSKQSKSVLFTLLMIWHRGGKENLISILPRDIIVMIFDWHIFLSSTTLARCRIAYLDCNHVFHDCCFQRWLKKREYCPLCAGDASYVVLERIGPLYQFKHVVAQSVKASKVGAAQFKETVSLFVCRTLKHERAAMKISDIRDRLLKFLSSSTGYRWHLLPFDGDTVFKSELERLTGSGFITQVSDELDEPQFLFNHMY